MNGVCGVTSFILDIPITKRLQMDFSTDFADAGLCNDLFSVVYDELGQYGFPRLAGCVDDQMQNGCDAR
jgi:hypothetical protein